MGVPVQERVQGLVEGVEISVLNTFRRRTNSNPDPPPNGPTYLRGFTADGVVIGHRASDLSAVALDPRPIDHPVLDSLLAQVEDEGMTVESGNSRLLPWENVFDLLASPDYRGCREMLALPEDAPHVPVLSSFNTLNDRDFSIAVEGWRRPDEGRPEYLETRGAIIIDGVILGLVSRKAWELTSQVSRFQERPESERDGASNRCVERRAKVGHLRG